MTFGSPTLLISLIPWSAVAVWLMLGNRQRIGVPFLALWRGAAPALPKKRAAFHRPPPAVLLALLAMLAGIIAAAQPTVGAGSTGAAITIIIDRGMTMSARVGGAERWKELATRVEPQILRQFGSGPVDLICVPDGELMHAGRSDWLTAASSQVQSSDSIDTRSTLLPIVESALSRGDGPVIVLSDRRLDIDAPRLIEVAPNTALKNVGIVTASAIVSPRAQAMIRIRNDSDSTVAELKVAGQSRQISLPPAGQERNYFIDLEATDEPIPIEIVAQQDDLSADDHATLTIRRNWPKIDPRPPLPAEVVRMIQSYAKLRPSGSAAAEVVVSAKPIDSQVRGVVLAPAASEAPAEPPATGPQDEIRVEKHPVTANVDWDAVGRSSLSFAPPPPDAQGWRAVASAGDQVILAVREAPARQVWVGFTSDAFPRTSDFVIFWTNLFDWTGQGRASASFEGTPAEPLSEPVESDWRRRLASMSLKQQSGMNLSRPLALVAVVLITLSLAAFTRRRSMP